MGRPGLTRHRKFLRLARNLDRHHSGLGFLLARGVLEHLWDAAYESGDPYAGDVDDIESAVHWPGPAGACCEALVSAGGKGHVGFIEPADGGGYIIHDLWDHAPEYVQRRMEREAARHAKGVTLSDLRRTAAQARWAPRKAHATDAPVLQTADACIDIMQTDANGVTPAPAPAPKKRKKRPPNSQKGNGPTSWLTEPAAVWRAAYRGEFPFKKAAKLLKPVVDAVGCDEMVRRLRKYTSATPAQFSSLAKFAETHGSYADAAIGPEGNRSHDGPTPRPNAEVERLRGIEAKIAQERGSTSGDRGTR